MSPSSTPEARSHSTISTASSRPSASRLRLASSAARSERSVAVTRVPGRSEAIERAMHPVPVPTSSTRTASSPARATASSTLSSAASTRISVSGRGMSTPALAAQHDVTEGHLTRHVLKRLPRSTTLYCRMHGGELARLERLVKVDVELHPREATHVGEQPLRRETRVLVASALKIAARPVENALDGPGLRPRHPSPFSVASLHHSAMPVVNPRPTVAKDAFDACAEGIPMQTALS